jgi:uncharacterized protein YkwD
MNFAMLLSWVLGLPGLALSGLLNGGLPNMQQPAYHGTVVQSPAPSTKPATRVPQAGATPHMSSAPRPGVPPKPSASPKPPVSAAGGTAAKLGTAEIASEATCPGQSDAAKAAQALPCLAANARVFHGLPAVSAHTALMAAAAAKTRDMLSCGYSHTACGRDFGYWTRAKGYTGRCYGENIAMGQTTPREVFVAWMNSAGHRANILNKDYSDIGVAELAGINGPLWAMELGGCRS